MSETKLPKLCLVYVHGVCIGVGTQIKDNSPLTIHEVYLNTLLPELNKNGQPRDKDEGRKYKDSIIAAKEVMRRWNSYDALLEACRKAEGAAYNEDYSVSELRDIIQSIVKPAMAQAKE